MKCDCIIQARLGSTRFPRKVLSMIDGKPLIQFIIDNLKRSEKLDRIVVATTQNQLDDELCAYCDEHSIPYFRGSEENVLKRYIDTCSFYNCRDIVRVCSDNPFIDIQKLDNQIDHYFAKNADYCTYSTKSGTPIILKPIGLFAEVVTYEALKKSYELASEKNHFEHVTFFIYSNASLFNIETISLEDHDDYRFTIDYPEDLIFCNQVAKKISGKHTVKNLLELLQQDRELRIANLDFSKTHKKAY